MGVEGRPGRELNRQVALVMGWQEISQESLAYETGYRWLTPDGYKKPWLNFSEDIGAAMIAFEWLSRKLPHRVLIGGYVQPAAIVLDRPDTFKNSYTAYGETYAHAICLAAVRWANQEAS